MKKVLGLLLLVQVAGIRTQEVIEDRPAAVECEVDTLQPMYIDTPEVVVLEDVGRSCEHKGFLCRLFEAIKNFFTNLIQKIKNLFAPQQEATVEMVIATTDADNGADADNQDVVQVVDIPESNEDTDGESAEDVDSDDEDDMKLSNAKRKNLSQEPSWLQQRS